MTTTCARGVGGSSGREGLKDAIQFVVFSFAHQLQEPADFISKQLTNLSAAHADVVTMTRIFAEPALLHCAQFVGSFVSLPDAAKLDFIFWEPPAPACGWCPGRVRVRKSCKH